MKKKGLVALAIAAVLILGMAAATCLIAQNYYIVNFHLYSKDTAILDLRDQEISIKGFQKLSGRFPECRILWNVPFQGGVLASDTTQITVDSLSGEDVAALAFFPSLNTFHAEACTDYENLMQLTAAYPDLAVYYQVSLDGTDYAQDAKTVELSHASEETLSRLACLPELQTVTACGSAQPQDFSAVRTYCEEKGITFQMRIGSALVSTAARNLTLEDVTDEDLSLLPGLTELKTLCLINPQAQPETIFSLQEQYPDVDISWEIQIGGQTFPSNATEVDLSATVIEDLAEVEQKMAYLPDAETVIFGLCGIDNPDWGTSKTKNLAVCEIENEDMAAYRDRVRDQYKVVWTVRLGPSIALRTDKDNFMPNHFGVGRLFNDYAYNLRYCEDMVCLDVGHMTLTDISFVSYMPKLKYLILAWTEVQYIEPIRSCKNLIWLELDNSCIRDYSPLVDCTALQDLNIGRTYCDITPILEMKWLKNLYMIFCSGGSAWQASQALPDTHVVASGDATVGGGWRRLPNYYDMRDCLNMYYMN